MTARPASPTPTLIDFTSGVDARLRGISAVDARTAWASGSKGTVLRTRDGGQQWQWLRVPGAEALDFRDIEGFDGENAVVMAAGPGEKSRVFRTSDGGLTWTQTLATTEPNAFFDCMAFDGARGWLLGDPIDGRFQLYTTTDAGRSWILDGNGPPAAADEAAFAASGSCIARLDGATGIASGGGASRLQLRRDGTTAWRAVETGMARGKAAAGAFALAAWRDGAVLVGGDYTAEQSRGNAARWSAQSGGMQTLAQPRGYRSGVACHRTGCIAVGPSGVEFWDGREWRVLSDSSFDAVSIRGNLAWLSGAKGALARIDLPR